MSTCFAVDLKHFLKINRAASKTISEANEGALNIETLIPTELEKSFFLKEIRHPLKR